MSFVDFLFLFLFAVPAACILHQFAHVHEFSSLEFLEKLLGAGIGAFLGPMVLGHWWIVVEGVWFAPELVGALIGATLVAVAWKVQARGASEAAPDAEPKPVTH